jgi:hypothetical protein
MQAGRFLRTQGQVALSYKDKFYCFLHYKLVSTTYLELGEAVTVGEDVSEHVEEQAVHGEGGEPGVYLQGKGAEAVPHTRPEPGVHAHLRYKIFKYISGHVKRHKTEDIRTSDTFIVLILLCSCHPVLLFSKNSHPSCS